MDKKADKAYHLLKEKGRFTSYDVVGLGVLEKYKRSRLFAKLCERHSNVKLKMATSPKDGRKITVAYLDGQAIEKYEKGPDAELSKFMANYVSRSQISQRFGISLEEVQRKITQLVGEKIVTKHPTEDKFKWDEK